MERLLFRRLFQKSEAAPAVRPTVDGRQARVPQGTRAYVIGDIHGRLDLLRKLEAEIVEDMASTGGHLACFVVYVGDYVDRGFESAQTLEHLIHLPMTGCRRVCLLGNHDVWLREFARGGAVGPPWIQHGGDGTLLSYGARLDLQLEEQERLRRARASLLNRMPTAHLTFLDSLELAFSMGDYFFCHAGVRPEVPLHLQSDNDLVWIREPFLSYSGEIDKVVVHGHTPTSEPVVKRHRIGIDTGACWTGKLTALVLEDDDFRFLSTGGQRAG